MFPEILTAASTLLPKKRWFSSNYIPIVTWISAATLIKFVMPQMRHLFEGSLHLKVEHSKELY